MYEAFDLWMPGWHSAIRTTEQLVSIWFFAAAAVVAVAAVAAVAVVRVQKLFNCSHIQPNRATIQNS